MAANMRWSQRRETATVWQRLPYGPGPARAARAQARPAVRPRLPQATTCGALALSALVALASGWRGV